MEKIDSEGFRCPHCNKVMEDCIEFHEVGPQERIIECDYCYQLFRGMIEYDPVFYSWTNQKFT